MARTLKAQFRPLGFARVYLFIVLICIKARYDFGVFDISYSAGETTPEVVACVSLIFVLKKFVLIGRNVIFEIKASIANVNINVDGSFIDSNQEESLSGSTHGLTHGSNNNNEIEWSELGL